MQQMLADVPSLLTHSAGTRAPCVYSNTSSPSRRGWGKAGQRLSGGGLLWWGGGASSE